MSTTPTNEDVDLGEQDYEIWDGEIVVKGQPSMWHEAMRAELIRQLGNQLPEHLRVVTSSALGDDRTSAHSDGSIVARGPSGMTTLAWIEVISESDLRRGDSRLLGRRRRKFLFGEGLPAIWVVGENFGRIHLNVVSSDGSTEVFAPPATVTLTFTHGTDRYQVAIDLGRLEEAGDLMDDA